MWNTNIRDEKAGILAIEEWNVEKGNESFPQDQERCSTSAAMEPIERGAQFAVSLDG
jgi:hypothetical protein